MQFTSLARWRSRFSLGLNTYSAFPFLCSSSAGVLQSSFPPGFVILPESYLGLLFYSSGKGGIAGNSFSFLILTWWLSGFCDVAWCLSSSLLLREQRGASAAASLPSQLLLFFQQSEDNYFTGILSAPTEVKGANRISNS